MLQVFIAPRLSLTSILFLCTEYSWTDPVSLKPKVGQSINDLGIVDYRRGLAHHHLLYRGGVTPAYIDIWKRRNRLLLLRTTGVWAST